MLVSFFNFAFLIHNSLLSSAPSPNSHSRVKEIPTSVGAFEDALCFFSLFRASCLAQPLLGIVITEVAIATN